MDIPLELSFHNMEPSDALKAAVLQRKADIGIALDGDADRCLMVDAGGNEVDGDQIMYILARSKLAAGALKGPVVGTLMSNLGLEKALGEMGIGFERANVGDRYVMEMLKSKAGTLGGETSGHAICLDKTTTGDGMVTALQVLAAMVQSGQPLADLLKGMNKLPQLLINVPVKGKAKPILELAVVRAAEQASVSRLGSRGRVLLRASGTEPLIRVMVEAMDEAETRREAESIAAAVRAAVA